MILRILFFIFLPLFFSSCEKHSDSSIWSVEVGLVQHHSSKGLKLLNFQFTLKSKDSLRLVMDWKSFSTDCYYHESQGLIESCYNDLTCVLDKINYNEVVVEMGNQQMFFLSGAALKPEKNYPQEDVNCMQDWFAYYDLIPDKKCTLPSISMFFDYFSHYNAEKIRFHYLYKPNDKQISERFKPLILSSNWFEIPPTGARME